LWFYDIDHPEFLEEELLRVVEGLILGKEENKTKLELILSGLFMKGFSWEIGRLPSGGILFGEWFTVK